MRNDFPNTSRIRADAEIRQVLRTGRAERGHFFASHALPNSEGKTRLAVVVSKKVSPRAVERNRIKRRIRECFRTHRSAPWAVDLVVVARRASSQAPTSQLDEQLRQQWKKLAAQ